MVGGREEDKDKVRKAGLVRQIRPESISFYKNIGQPIKVDNVNKMSNNVIKKNKCQ